MKYKIIVILVILISSVIIVNYDKNIFSTNDTRLEQVKFNKMDAVDFPFKDLSGDNFHLFDIKDKTILLHFWASWCGICKVEFPALLDLVHKDPNLVFLAVATDDEIEDAVKFLSVMTRRHPDKVNNGRVYLTWDRDSEISIKTYNVKRVPETFVINKDFKIFDKIIGNQDWYSKEIRDRLKE